MRLIIVSGLSGSGKSIALHVLEDLGYYCIDNMPAALLKPVINEVTAQTDESTRLLAVGVDARNRNENLEALPQLIEELRQQGIQTELLFLQSSDEVLLKRYGETRRRHPLARQGTALRAAIIGEREMLSVVLNSADLVIDTSRTSIYELANTIRERIDRRTTDTLSVLIESFGFKHGIPSDADFVFDLRSLPNPYWTVELRGLTGLDQEVIDFLDAQPAFVAMYEDILNFLQRWIPEYENVHRAYLTVAIGCTGGQHRSVYMTEKLTNALREMHDPVLARHNELATPSHGNT
ncbi:MAG: RNase adapter RapZ [Gammaproteobacteria bacterium]|nr:RNase adapter RapZ [Gammaproteobacteria bacterium]MDH3428724.1 RNase adapter RapZ [Gammaproteobacteria bacterium]